MSLHSPPAFAALVMGEGGRTRVRPPDCGLS